MITKDEGKCILLHLDANAKLGSTIIKGDKKEMSKKGELLFDMMERQELTALNSLELCQGVITRERITVDGIERSTIDYVIM